ncbi:hypothetical protein BT96DRAFT_1007807 [Gymnopus androsaceus JB14]|uniref:Uncharacterized protein n=1 Tax=Gymnopus androsaceus JB14 TaxID=1447944 RepID=A0A6A4GH44_9AGAR|nr:hypothetical protein BT96DRAFT_1007807 [Gymnopus androsaceus JB14]
MFYAVYDAFTNGTSGSPNQPYFRGVPLIALITCLSSTPSSPPRSTLSRVPVMMHAFPIIWSLYCRSEIKDAGEAEAGDQHFSESDYQSQSEHPLFPKILPKNISSVTRFAFIFSAININSVISAVDRSWVTFGSCSKVVFIVICISLIINGDKPYFYPPTVILPPYTAMHMHSSPIYLRSTLTWVIAVFFGSSRPFLLSDLPISYSSPTSKHKSAFPFSSQTQPPNRRNLNQI